jgi:signal transduction histidine kinase
MAGRFDKEFAYFRYSVTDRVEALGGTISIVSPRRGGTALSVQLPITT